MQYVQELEKTCVTVIFVLYGFFIGLMFSQMFLAVNLSWITVSGMFFFYLASMKYA